MLRLKKISFILFFLFLSDKIFSQQRPQYTQYLFNSYLLNPAITGIENYTDVKIGYRQQWVGLKDNPKTGFISAHWALGNEYLWSNALSFNEDGHDPRSNNYTQNYTASPAHHGIGFSLVNDQAAQLSTFALNISYAYHLKLNNQLNLSLGTALGYTRIGINVENLKLEKPQDPALNNAVNKIIKPDLSIGLWLYGSQFFTGISAQQIIQQKLSFSNSTTPAGGKQVPHFFINSGYKFNFDEFNTVPSILIKYVNGTPIALELNLKIGFKDKFWLGVGYRKNDAFTYLAGFNINHFFNVSYAYDITTSELNNASNGSHEIVLGVLLNNVYKVICPKRMW